MQIVADEDILSLDRLFHKIGILNKHPGRTLTSQDLTSADALLVRSITKVDKKLLGNTPVKFVGTATSGIDHIDTDYLHSRGIGFSHAEGCNANAVVEYCFTALSLLSCLHGIKFRDRSIAIIGAGNVGGLFVTRLARLGYHCLICDPFISSQRRKQLIQLNCRFVELDAALQADVISLHVPLTLTGSHPTFHLLNRENLQKLPPHTVLINTSRGEVIDNLALANTLEMGKELYTVLDVWENEPDINPGLLSRVTLASPHIAGYSIEAKLKASLKLLHDFCDYFSIAHDAGHIEAGDEKLPLPYATVRIGTHKNDEFCAEILNAVMPLAEIDKQLKVGLLPGEGKQVYLFDSMRKQLASRHEFSAYQIESGAVNQNVSELLSVLGFSFQL